MPATALFSYNSVNSGINAYQAGQAGDMTAFAYYGANSLFNAFGAATTGYTAYNSLSARFRTARNISAGIAEPVSGSYRPDYRRWPNGNRHRYVYQW